MLYCYYTIRRRQFPWGEAPNRPCCRRFRRQRELYLRPAAGRSAGRERAAVHKAAQALSAQGYTLDSAPRRGYRLAGGDPFCAEAVGPYPAPIHIYDTLQSSNLTAKQLALGGAPHGTLVLTAHQKAGRGRLGRRFESPAGKGVYLSLILRPALSAADARVRPSVRQWPWPGLSRPFAGWSWASNG